ncbi:hypothetical protein [Candidatus Nesciobacter abundans]|uniref:Uncharacterized protein n=1 Tax=Candidatus Nesciobacter abundans TaxID=2601668 RepID=A0A5C0UJT0_9PROT|nr:hypothetical protein [Candidatus Nesciobacter abundans]QEK39074.1 hypothetical protein FZC36_01320 [Candidatus Nesciobacter abundans]
MNVLFNAFLLLTFFIKNISCFYLDIEKKYEPEHTLESRNTLESLREKMPDKNVIGFLRCTKPLEYEITFEVKFNEKDVYLVKANTFISSERSFLSDKISMKLENGLLKLIIDQSHYQLYSGQNEDETFNETSDEMKYLKRTFDFISDKQVKREYKRQEKTRDEKYLKDKQERSLDALCQDSAREMKSIINEENLELNRMYIIFKNPLLDIAESSERKARERIEQEFMEEHVELLRSSKYKEIQTLKQFERLTSMESQIRTEIINKWVSDFTKIDSRKNSNLIITKQEEKKSFLKKLKKLLKNMSTKSRIIYNEIIYSKISKEIKSKAYEELEKSKEKEVNKAYKIIDLEVSKKQKTEGFPEILPKSITKAINNFKELTIAEIEYDYEQKKIETENTNPAHMQEIDSGDLLIIPSDCLMLISTYCDPGSYAALSQVSKVMFIRIYPLAPEQYRRNMLMHSLVSHINQFLSEFKINSKHSTIFSRSIGQTIYKSTQNLSGNYLKIYECKDILGQTINFYIKTLDKDNTTILEKYSIGKTITNNEGLVFLLKPFYKYFNDMLRAAGLIGLLSSEEMDIVDFDLKYSEYELERYSEHIL